MLIQRILQFNSQWCYIASKHYTSRIYKINYWSKLQCTVQFRVLGHTHAYIHTFRHTQGNETLCDLKKVTKKKKKWNKVGKQKCWCDLHFKKKLEYLFNSKHIPFRSFMTFTFLVIIISCKRYSCGEEDTDWTYRNIKIAEPFLKICKRFTQMVHMVHYFWIRKWYLLNQYNDILRPKQAKTFPEWYLPQFIT